MNENLGMDELVQRLGMAVSNISSCIPATEAWSGPAASALSEELHEISAEVGALILDLLSNNAYSTMENLGLTPSFHG